MVRLAETIVQVVIAKRLHLNRVVLLTFLCFLIKQTMQDDVKCYNLSSTGPSFLSFRWSLFSFFLFDKALKVFMLRYSGQINFIILTPKKLG